MKYNRSEIMKAAWEMKRSNIRLAGKVRNEYNKSAFMTFGQCLANAWAKAKREAMLAAAAEQAAKTTRAWVIPNWMMYEKELFGVRSNTVKVSEIEKETNKAFRIRGQWVPKSVCDFVEVNA